MSVESPKRRRISQTGTCAPISSDVRNTGRIARLVTVNGISTRACPCATAAHIRTCCIYRRVDGALHVGRAIVGSYDIAASVELHDVGQLDQLRGARARQQEMVLLDGMAKAEMGVWVNRADMGGARVGDNGV